MSEPLPLPPLPKASPRPPAPPLDEPRTDPHLKAMRYDAAKKRRPWWVGLATVVITAITGTWGHVETRSAELQKEHDERVRDVRHLEAGQTETRTDIRELYTSVMLGRRSERLEQPPPVTVKDGGP